MRANESSTGAFYDKNAIPYALQTQQADLRALYSRFLPLLAGGRILDLGCGGGRDLRAFKALGFDCIGMDPSSRLAQVAAESSGCEVIVARAQDLSIADEFDGIWACASLLHIYRSELPSTFYRVRRALRLGGIMFLSMQLGSGSFVAPDGRFYELYSIRELDLMVASAGFDVIEKWVTSDTLPERRSISWINLLARSSAPKASKANAFVRAP